MRTASPTANMSDIAKLAARRHRWSHPVAGDLYVVARAKGMPVSEALALARLAPYRHLITYLCR